MSESFTQLEGVGEAILNSRDSFVPTCASNTESAACVGRFLPASHNEFGLVGGERCTSFSLAVFLSHGLGAHVCMSVNHLGFAKHRGQSTRFGIKAADRRQHIDVIGKTGVGKSTLLENCLVQDIEAGRGVGFIDPHGDTAERLLDSVPSTRPHDVLYFDPSDTANPISFNILRECIPEKRPLMISGLVGTFKKMFGDSWGWRLEYILANSIAALAEHPEATLLDVPDLLVNEDYRARIVERVTDIVVRRFWLREFAGWSENYQREAVGAVQNKVGALLRNPILRNILGQPTAKFDLRYVMDNRQIFIANLAKGKIGEDEARLLGSLLVTKFQLAAMSRADIPEEERVDFGLVIDEAHNFLTPAFASILSEARKYRLCLMLAHQYVDQLKDKASQDQVFNAVFGNIGTLVAFRPGAADAEFLAKEFAPQIGEQDFLDLPRYHFYIKLMIDGLTEPPFMAETLPPIAPAHGRSQEIKNFSRQRFTKSQDDVEHYIWQSLSSR